MHADDFEIDADLEADHRGCEVLNDLRSHCWEAVAVVIGDLGWRLSDAP